MITRYTVKHNPTDELVTVEVTTESPARRQQIERALAAADFRFLHRQYLPENTPERTAEHEQD